VKRRALIGGALLTLAVAACSEAAPVTTTSTTSAATTTAFPLTTTAAPPTTVTPSTTSPAAPSTTTSTTTTTTLPPLTGLAYEPVITEGLKQPVVMTTAPGSDLWYIVERHGAIRRYDPSTAEFIEPFADLGDRVGTRSIEMGLLGLAFHPEFDTNRRFFVYYTDPSTDSHLSEFATGPDGLADPASEKVLLDFEQPTERHNGGMLQFGPDGLLWVSLGEGGKASRHAQHPETLLASILRIDVDHDPDGSGYAIPADNPFADGVDGAPEVWAYGLRNPWRFSIDAVARQIYIADVGQAEWEELDVVSIDDHSGHNFGWLPVEGFECFLSRCNPDDFTPPVLVYGHDEGCSITGGHVYRGPAIPELDGHYLYSDWCTGFLRSITFDAEGTLSEFDWTDHVGVAGQVDAFGRDAAGELYVLTWSGEIHRLVGVR
jgi:glucose/arabinose dehydrogenase